MEAYIFINGNLDKWGELPLRRSSFLDFLITCVQIRVELFRCPVELSEEEQNLLVRLKKELIK